MSLVGVLDDLAAYLAGAVDPVPPLVGIGTPAAPGDLPALRLSVRDVTQAMRGIGERPAQSMTGALAVTSTVDVADPRVVFADGVADLLSPDRRTLSLPHGPVVRADGTSTPGPWSAADITVSVAGTGRPVVTDPPTGTQVQLVPPTSTLVFPAPLPATGTVAVSYHVGEWDVSAQRYQGVLDVDVYAADVAALGGLRSDVETALAAGPVGASLKPVAVGPVGTADPAAAGSRMATSSFAFDIERIVPRLPSGGGVISQIDVQPAVDANPVESFTVPAGSS